jgi:hypothetical protein
LLDHQSDESCFVVAPCYKVHISTSAGSLDNGQIARIDATPQQFDANDAFNPNNALNANPGFVSNEYYRADDFATDVTYTVYFNPSLEFHATSIGFDAMTFASLKTTVYLPDGQPGDVQVGVQWAVTVQFVVRPTLKFCC